MKKALLFIAGTLAGGVLFFVMHSVLEKEKTPYVSMAVLFEESEIGKKYKLELDKMETESNARLSVLQQELKSAAASGESKETLDKMQQELFAAQENLTNAYRQKSAAFDKIVWEKLNGKIAAFGKEKGYDYIFGAKGDGAIMYASDQKDVTEELLQFINR